MTGAAGLRARAAGVGPRSASRAADVRHASDFDAPCVAPASDIGAPNVGPSCAPRTDTVRTASRHRRDGREGDGSADLTRLALRSCAGAGRLARRGWDSVSGAAARLAVAALLLPAGAADAASPYAGEEARAIASLSEADVAALLAGEGRGFALPAELNGWPGPTHLLELAAPLALTDGQVAAIEAIFATMRAEARRLGADYVAAERALDAAFAGGEIDAARLAPLTAEAGRLRAELRRVHLEAHLAARPLLTRHQIHEYDRLRGYGAGGDGPGHGHGGHGAQRAPE